ncbi:Ino80 complex subunit Iec3 [Schizosaccharomyces japonicus yFS275]|uniref:Ino80 complex subunit Iec3 n=1 Tax=Schizosaccharomyces japonicus (strain yFS275 / FY16936) TaxID=402676 RepID=B6JWU8_SCHJY|nr:Ino80 complex subunit Iec3 [Schizosaccharomyces japonicus yFS275]EEB05849.1 Ino80 complex subunit Iec3 [Schizosaccharomyces japonicus yFS275]
MSFKSFKRKYLKLRKSFDVACQETTIINNQIEQVSIVYRRIQLENMHLLDLLLDMQDTDQVPIPAMSPPGSPYWQENPPKHVGELESELVLAEMKPFSTSHPWNNGFDPQIGMEPSAAGGFGYNSNSMSPSAGNAAFKFKRKSTGTTERRGRRR